MKRDGVLLKNIEMTKLLIDVVLTRKVKLENRKQTNGYLNYVSSCLDEWGR